MGILERCYHGHVGEGVVAGLSPDADCVVGFERRFIKTGECCTCTGGFELGGCHNSDMEEETLF